MAGNRQFDETVSRWLEETAPARLPERVLSATFERTRRRRQHVGWRALRDGVATIRFAPALGGAAVVVVAAAVALNVFGPSLGGPLSVDPRQPFLGVWISTSDADGGTQTMTVGAGADGTLEIVVRNDIATVCSLTPSTMTATGRIDDEVYLVMPAPMYTCDDGSEPEAVGGPPREVQLRNFTLVRDARSDTLSDGRGGIWWREGAERPSPEPPGQPTISDSAWPQSSLEEVRQAQELADAGDPAYTWQVEPQIEEYGSPSWSVGESREDAEIVERFLREELGWEDFVFNGHVGWEDYLSNMTYVRCAPGRTNPLYPNDPYASECAPTIDESRYETVQIDLAQPGQEGPSGIWVVSRWAISVPFAQADPRVIEAEATGQLEDFLRARINGAGAEPYVEVTDAVEEIPLLYGTTTGSPYERYELERVGGPHWPYGWMEFVVRLFADDGETVVEQPISLRDARLYLSAAETTESGQPLAVTYSFFDGTVTFSAADPWQVRGGLVDWGALTMGDFWSSEEGIELVACEPGPAPDDAQALARSIQSDPDHTATAPAEVRVGGVDGLVVDVTVAAGMSACGASFPSTEVVTRTTVAEGIRMRLYLLDLPEGSATRVLVIAIAAPEARFDAVIEVTAPIVESIEVHAP